MLVKAELRQAMRPLFEPGTMPSDDPVGDWVKAYAVYAQKAIAGPVALSAPLVPSTAGGQFIVGFDAALRKMWMSAVWVGPGVTALTSVVPPVQPFILALAPTLITSFDREQAATLIAEALHTYTLSIVVSVVPASGTPVPTPLT